MSYSIWKKPLMCTYGTIETVMLPKGSVILDSQFQDEELNLWFLCNTKAPEEARNFIVLGTGWPLKEAMLNTDHISTIQNGEYVWHVFETTKIDEYNDQRCTYEGCEDQMIGGGISSLCPTHEDIVHEKNFGHKELSDPPPQGYADCRGCQMLFRQDKKLTAELAEVVEENERLREWIKKIQGDIGDAVYWMENGNRA